MSTSFDTALNSAMLLLASHRYLFVGQGVAFGGVATFKHMEGVPESQRIEYPVAEEMQLSYCVGLALTGQRVCSVFPRVDFLMRAMDSLVNHLDKLEWMSRGQFAPRVIIRTRIGSTKPLDPGPQHSQDHTLPLSLMLKNVDVCKLTRAEEVIPAYQNALSSPRSSLIAEAF